MEKKFLSLDEIETRIRFDTARFRYEEMYSESVFNRCFSCKGTGLSTGSSDFTYWDCDSYCKECNGYGGNFVLGEIIFECNECKEKNQYDKIHCKKCRGLGYVDWLENMINKPTRLFASADEDFNKSQGFYGSLLKR